MPGDGTLLEVLFLLIVFGCILFLAYVVTRYIAGKSKIFAKGRHMNIVETISLGQDKRLHLLKIGNRHLLISSAGKTIDCLAEFEIEDEGIVEAEDEQMNEDDGIKDEYSFKNIIKKLTNSRLGKQPFHNNLDKLRRINGTFEERVQGKDGVEHADE